MIIEVQCMYNRTNKTGIEINNIHECMYNKHRSTVYYKHAICYVHNDKYTHILLRVYILPQVKAVVVWLVSALT